MPARTVLVMVFVQVSAGTVSFPGGYLNLFWTIKCYTPLMFECTKTVLASLPWVKECFRDRKRRKSDGAKLWKYGHEITVPTNFFNLYICQTKFCYENIVISTTNFFLIQLIRKYTSGLTVHQFYSSSQYSTLQAGQIIQSRSLASVY